MIDNRTNQDLTSFKILDDGQVYIYILMNELGKVKVGISTNILQRVNSLSGSNGQGIKITNCYVSEPTYLTCIEEIMHLKMWKYRIPDTEWFFYEQDISGKILFNSAIKLLNKLFNSKSYNICNQMRYEYKDKLKRKKCIVGK